MKNPINLIVAIVIFLGGLTACSGNNATTNNSDSNLTKIDTTLDPADRTKAIQSDSGYPNGAVGLDTVGGGKSMSSGRKDTSKHK